MATITDSDLNEYTVYKSALTKDQREAAIQKAHDIIASASEIDESVSKKFRFLLGDNLYDYSNKLEITDVSRWSIHIPGTDYVFENSTDFTKFSTKSIKFGNNTSGDTALSSRAVTLPEDVDMTDFDTITFWVYVEDEIVTNGNFASSWGSCLFLIGDLGLSNAKATNVFGMGGGSWTRGWNNITLHKNDFTIQIAGTIDWASIRQFQFRWDKLSNSLNTKMYLDSIIFGGILPERIPICITLDDSNREQFDMVNIMNAHGVPCSLNIIPDHIDDTTTYTNSLNIDEIDLLYKKGNHIGIHHQDSGAFGLDATKAITVSNWIKINGFIRDDGYLYGSYPNGATNQTTIDYLKSNGFLGFRTDAGRARDDSIGAESSRGLVSRESILNGGLSDSFRIIGKNPTDSSHAITIISKAIENKSAFVMISHAFSDLGGKSEWIALAKYLKTKIDDGTIECLTFPQFCKKYSN